MKSFFSRLPLILAATPAAAAIAPINLSVKPAIAAPLAHYQQPIVSMPGYTIPYIPPTGIPAPTLPPYLPLDGKPAMRLPGLEKPYRLHAARALARAAMKPAPLSDEELKEIFDGEERERAPRGWEPNDPGRSGGWPVDFPERELERELGLR